MGMESDVLLKEEGETGSKIAVSVSGTTAIVMEEVTLEDESEDEDVDFNPFLKESVSDEASSSLSSEVEGLDTDVVSSHGGNEYDNGNVLPDGSPKEVNDVVDEGQCGDFLERVSELDLELDSDRVLDEENSGFNRGTDGVEDAVVAGMGGKPLIDFDDEDAICKRTRARYSLASFTLDELETFLQETDDDDDIQNVDEEEEYRKFLAAVLNGGSGDQGNVEGNDDDDDEDNDADFEIEIEEALESDVDDCVVTSNKDERFERASRRPETRRKGQKKANSHNEKKVTQKEKQPLRPLLPAMPATSSASVPCINPRYHGLQTSAQLPQYDLGFLVNGFQPHQIGQLHTLIYEHVQLLVQVHSLCVLDSSRQHIASQIKGLLAELLHKRDLVLAWKKGPYSTTCFLPSYTCPSVSVENKEDSGASSNDGQGCRWMPVVGGSVQSVLDVAPLKLVGRYMDDVANAVREHQRCCVEAINIYLEKQPLFPLPICSSPELDVPSLHTNEASPNNKGPKKTLAATLVESTKKSVALVPQHVANVVQPFNSLFNPALFPHKPPAVAIANRVLFTDAEDVLLATGIMEYNNDWKSIQQRFLPCKSEHQIFVRAKNRCSAKAPENPIKAVRKMKTSPLTEEEKARIQEGLKAFKHDWTAVWRIMVPYRDPNLLPRQWRTAIGTQKSYKGDSAKRERHRVYELNRRRGKAVAMNYFPTGNEKENESGEDCMDNEDEAYVHEAFLADWRPSPCGVIPSKSSASSLKSSYLLGDVPVSAKSCDVQKMGYNHGNQEAQSDKGHACRTSSYPPPTPTSEPFGDPLFRSQRAGKPNISNLVKLAPELPPVKLPPAVRIISQASLGSSQLASSGEAGAAGPRLEKTFHDSAVFKCSANLVKPMHEKTMISNPNSASVYSQNDVLLKNGCHTKDGGTNLDPQMHPLLFRTTDEGFFPCYPVNNSMRIPTFSFFPPMQHQMNVTLLQNSLSAGPDDGLKSSSSKEVAPASSCLDFHPLLQRTKEFRANSLDPGLTSSVLNTDLELSRDQYMEDIVYDAGACAAQMAAARPTSPNVDANDLDLDIHLSFASKRRKVSSQKGVEIKSFPSGSGSRVVESEKARSNMRNGLSQPTDLVARRHMELPGTENSTAVPHKLDGRNCSHINDSVGTHPFLDIVMEQEELSDSDEELEDVEFEREELEDVEFEREELGDAEFEHVELEDVEFECEEMADSDEDEGSDAEEVVNTLNKEQSDIAFDTVGHTQLFNSVGSGASEQTRVQRKGRTVRMSLAGNDHTKGSWLSLNSHGSHDKRISRSKRTESSPGGLVPLLSSRCCKNSKKSISSPKDVSSNERQANLSQKDPFSTPSRNSRKHASKSSSPLRVDIPEGNSSCIDNDGKV